MKIEDSMMSMMMVMVLASIMMQILPTSIVADENSEDGNGNGNDEDTYNGYEVIITVNQIGDGTVVPSFKTFINTPIDLIAYPAPGWHFTEWRIDDVAFTSNPELSGYVVTKNISLLAVFEKDVDVPNAPSDSFSLGIVNAPGAGVLFDDKRYWAAQIGTYWTQPPGGMLYISERWVQQISTASKTGYFTIVIWDINSNELYRINIEDVTVYRGTNYNFNCATNGLEEI